MLKHVFGYILLDNLKNTSTYSLKNLVIFWQSLSVDNWYVGIISTGLRLEFMLKHRRDVSNGQGRAAKYLLDL